MTDVIAHALRLTDADPNDCTNSVIASAIEVHRLLGPGLLESVYEACLCRELSERGISFRRQVALPVEYKGTKLDAGLRIDLLVAESLVVEIKSVETLAPVHEAQLLTYLKLSGIETGLLLNFNVVRLKDGIKRMVLSRARK
jgi:GxxExxY protein